MNTQTLNKQEAAFLRKLASETLWCLRDGKASPRIQNLINRGYCRTSPVRIGPLGILTGDVCIRLTEAGRTFVANTSQSGTAESRSL